MTKFPVSGFAETDPHREAVWDRDRAISYAEFDRDALAAAGALRELGLVEGDRLALWMQPSRVYLMLIEAAFRIGAVVIPLSVREPASYVRERFEELKWRLLVVDDETAPIETELPAMNVRELKGTKPARSVDLMLDRPATIIFSSGSTARPKAVLHTWGNHYYNALGSAHNIALRPGDRWLLSLPLYHVAGIAILFRCFLAGATIVLPDDLHGLGESVQAGRVTHLSLVGAQLKRLLDEYTDVSSLKAILLGGSPIPQPLIEQARMRGMPVHTSYGMTETASQVTATPPGASPGDLASSGKLLPYRELQCRPDGEICVRGKTLFAGYLKGNEIHSPFDHEGWFRTGDLGTLDAEGWLRIVGRKDNMFISGGENVYPEEIERALESHPEVLRALVVPVADDVYGFRPAAIVESRGDSGGQEEWDLHLEGRVARFKRPVVYLSWDELPIPEAMKVSRKEVSRLVSERLTTG